MLKHEPINSDIPYIGRPRMKWPFADLNVGDNVLIYQHEKRTVKNICQAAYNFAAKRKWSVRTLVESKEVFDDNGERQEINAVRIWRIK